MAAADTGWMYRNPRLVRCGFDLRKSHSRMIMMIPPRTNPMTGDRTMGMTTFSTTPDQCTFALAARAEPTSPPIRA